MAQEALKNSGSTQSTHSMDTLIQKIKEVLVSVEAIKSDMHKSLNGCPNDRL